MHQLIHLLSSGGLHDLSLQIFPLQPFQYTVKMGHAHSSSSNQDPKQYLQSDVPKFSHQYLLSRGKFLKTFSGKIDDTNVVVKVYFRQCDDELLMIGRKLSKIWKMLPPSKYPNLLPYQMWLKSQNKMTRSNTSPTYLIRQFILHNLHDR